MGHDILTDDSLRTVEPVESDTSPAEARGREATGQGGRQDDPQESATLPGAPAMLLGP